MKNVVAEAIENAIDALERVEFYIPEDESNYYHEFVEIIHRLEDLKEEAEA